MSRPSQVVRRRRVRTDYHGRNEGVEEDGGAHDGCWGEPKHNGRGMVMAEQLRLKVELKDGKCWG